MSKTSHRKRAVFLVLVLCLGLMVLSGCKVRRQIQSWVNENLSIENVKEDFLSTKEDINDISHEFNVSCAAGTLSEKECKQGQKWIDEANKIIVDAERYLTKIEKAGKTQSDISFLITLWRLYEDVKSLIRK
jgi:hypothetical protein